MSNEGQTTGAMGMPYWGQVKLMLSSVPGAMWLTDLSFGAACNMVPFSSLPCGFG